MNVFKFLRDPQRQREEKGKTKVPAHKFPHGGGREGVGERVEEGRSDSSCRTQSLASVAAPQITPTTQHSVKLLTSKSRVAQQHQLHKSLKEKERKKTHTQLPPETKPVLEDAKKKS